MLQSSIRKTTFLLYLFMLAAVSANLLAAEREADGRKSRKTSSSTEAIKVPTQQQTTVASQKFDGAIKVDSLQAKPIDEPVQHSASAVPATGEHIGWMVFSGGGGRVTSASNSMDMTIGQTVSGVVSNGSFKLNQGFWQEFGSGSCCIGKRGNVNMAGITDLSDLSALVNYLTGGGYMLTCVDAANVNGAGIVDLSDLSALVNYLTGGGYVLPNCP